MKKIISLIALLCVVSFAVKAQYFTTIQVRNNTMNPDMYVSFTGNDGSTFPCVVTNSTSPYGPLVPGITYSYTVGSVTWSPATAVMGIHGLNFDIIPAMGPMEVGPIIGLCVCCTPPSPHSYMFVSGRRHTLLTSFPSPGTVLVSIN
ncbi:MAG TPA: hypothetical protein VL092_05375 [Chitinophagaceae bacterium]|nr:hypothetical protein [Chitinophagaceae bacterium]